MSWSFFTTNIARKVECAVEVSHFETAADSIHDLVSNSFPRSFGPGLRLMLEFDIRETIEFFMAEP
jgi:hypothetical protein